jgi:dephospho-CoA kinase
MIVFGLTGGIGMGKSAVAGMFEDAGVPAFNADDAVHTLQAPGGRALPALNAAFPGTVRAGVLDRARLRAIVLSDDAAMRRLEAIMHPLVHGQEALFRAAALRTQRRAVLLDIPLLFETGADMRVDITLTVSCPAALQLARVLARGLPEDQAHELIARQMPDAEKRRLADAVIPTGLSLAFTRRRVRRLLRKYLP